MFNESTENLLDDLENELTEVIELKSPKENQKAVESDKEEMPPIPAKRNLAESSENVSNPVPAARKLQSLDKKEKNDENEIIQLSSISSTSASENHKNISQNTIVIASDKKAKVNNKILVVQEADQAEETFFVTKHGKWAQDEKEQEALESTPREIKQQMHSPEARDDAPKPPHLEIISEKPTKSASKLHVSTSTSTTAQTSYESSSETSSSAEECLKTKKKSKKKLKDKEKKKTKKQKSSSGDQPTSTEDSGKKDENKTNLGHAIGKTCCRYFAIKSC